MADLIMAKLFDNDPATGWVSVFPFDTAIVAHFNGLQWEPVCGIRKGGGRIELPSCFELAEDLEEALTQLAQNGEGGELCRLSVSGTLRPSGNITRVRRARPGTRVMRPSIRNVRKRDGSLRAIAVIPPIPLR